MALPAILAALPALAPVLDRVLSSVLPDPKERAAAVAQATTQMVEVLQSSDMAQVQVNQAEAASPHPFAAFWRPAAGWVCVVGLAYDCLVRPLAPWVLTVAGTAAPPLPALGETLWVLLFGMLGLGTWRTYEKQKGTDLRR